MIELNHTIIPANDKHESAEFYSRILGVENKGELYHFTVVQINERLSLDFANSESFKSMHYAFKVDDQKFGEIFSRIKEESLTYGSGPSTSKNGEINNWNGGKGVYFHDPNGHLLELLTQNYTGNEN